MIDLHVFHTLFQGTLAKTFILPTFCPCTRILKCSCSSVCLAKKCVVKFYFITLKRECIIIWKCMHEIPSIISTHCLKTELKLLCAVSSLVPPYTQDNDVTFVTSPWIAVIGMGKCTHLQAILCTNLPASYEIIFGCSQ